MDEKRFLMLSCRLHTDSAMHLKQWAMRTLELPGLWSAVQLWLGSDAADHSVADLKVAPVRNLERAWKTLIGESEPFPAERGQLGNRIRRGVLRADGFGRVQAWSSSLSHCGPASMWGAVLLTQELCASEYTPAISVGIDIESTSRWIHPGVRRLTTARDGSDRSLFECGQIPLAALVSIKEAVFKADRFQSDRTLASYALFDVRKDSDTLWCGRAKVAGEANGSFWFAMQLQADCCLSLALAIGQPSLPPAGKSQDDRPHPSRLPGNAGAVCQSLQSRSAAAADTCI
jgi:hypothetical protein